MNVLLTSAGRRSYLVEYFKEALSGRGLVFASNSEMSPALMVADEGIISPLIYSEEYIPFLKELCRKKEIGLLVSLFDIDLPVLARHKKEFEELGVCVAVSDEDVIRNCNDKYGMFLKLWKLGIRCPETCISLSDAKLKLMARSLNWPVVVKPRFGMGSISISRAWSKEELKALYGLCERAIKDSYLKYEAAACPKESVLIQDAVEGQEYGLDVVNDLSGSFAAVIIRKKLAMRAGETDEAVILGPEDPEYPVLSELGRAISGGFGHVGNMDVDVILDPDNMRPYVIDMNARFGGGYPFSHLAGADLPRAYLAWAEGREAEPAWLTAKPHVHGYKELTVKLFDEGKKE